MTRVLQLFDIDEKAAVSVSNMQSVWRAVTQLYQAVLAFADVYKSQYTAARAAVVVHRAGRGCSILYY